MSRFLFIALLAVFGTQTLSQSLWADGAVDSVFNRTYGMADGLTFAQNLDAQLPLDTPFVDEYGRDVKLGNYFGKAPVILAMAYYKCPNICTVVMRETFQTLQKLSFTQVAPYEVVFISINPKETPNLALKKKNNYQRSYHNLPIEKSTHFLTGDEASIKKVADTIGFQYRWDDVAQQYIHPSGILVATPEGKLSRYLYGIRYDGRDLRLSLVEASKNKIGGLVDQFLLFCYQYDPSHGKYGFAVMGAVRILGGVTVTALGGFILAMMRRDRRSRKKRDEGRHQA